MGYANDRLMILCLLAIVVLSAFAVGVGVGSVVLVDAVRRAKEIATRRVVGATRGQITRAFVGNATGLVLLGLLVGTIILLVVGKLSLALPISCFLTGFAALCGAWIGARRAARTPTSKSGLFGSAPDKREDFNSR
jgi:ABC-type antimicrobial peptide transport system permease subunit